MEDVMIILRRYTITNSHGAYVNKALVKYKGLYYVVSEYDNQILIFPHESQNSEHYVVAGLTGENMDYALENFEYIINECSYI